MISISKATKELLDASPVIQEALADGLVNISALARTLQPRIEQQLLKPASLASIVMSLQRLQTHYQKLTTLDGLQQALRADLSIRSRLMLTIFVYRPSLLTAQQRILEKVAEDRTAFFAMCYGTAKTTCLIDMQHAELLNAETAQEQILNQRQLVSAITVQFLQQITDTPGVYYRIFKELAWANVNVVELLSSGDELTLVFENAVIDRAFSVLKQCVQP